MEENCRIMNNENTFKNKTDTELVLLYRQFKDPESKGGISDDCELGKIRDEMFDRFGANTVLMLQIELTHEIADRWIERQNL